jgi:hypothetical protein
MLDQLFGNIKDWLQYGFKERHLEINSSDELDTLITKQTELQRIYRKRRDKLFMQDEERRNTEFRDDLKLSFNIQIWNTSIHGIRKFMPYVRKHRDIDYQMVSGFIKNLVDQGLIPTCYHSIKLCNIEDKSFLFFIKFNKEEAFHGQDGVMSEESFYAEYENYIQTTDYLINKTEKAKSQTAGSAVDRYEGWSNYGREIIEAVESENFKPKDFNHIKYIINHLSALASRDSLYFDGININANIFQFRYRGDDQPANIISFDDFVELYRKNTEIEV